MRAMVAIAAVLALAGSCGDKSKNKDKTRSDGEDPSSAKAGSSIRAATPGGVMSPAATALFDAVPGDAVAVAFIDSPQSFWSALTGGMLVPFTPDRRKALDTDLKKLLEERLGIDPSSVTSVVGFVRFAAMRPTGAVLIGGVRGQLKGATGGADASLVLIDKDSKIVAAKKGDVVIVGPEAGVRAAFETVSGKRDSLVKQKAKVFSWIKDEAGGGFFGAAAWTDGVDHPQVRGVAMQTGAERAVLRIGRGGSRLRVQGDKAKLAPVVDNFMRGMRAQLAQVEQLRARSSAPGAPLSAALGGILQYHWAMGVSAQLEPRPYAKGMQIEMPVQFSGASIFVAVIGVASAVAIPAFLKYIRKSKTSEARIFVKKMYDGARVHHMDKQSLPKSTPMTPPLGTCCAGGGDKCAPSAKQWEHPSWTALMFSVDDPHYYSYQFVSQGQSFTVRAVGDLDCDGEYATFEMHGLIDASGNLSGQPNLMRIRELE